jgi:pimeloyl-ACP methyl ester carboxylesterase
MTEHFFKHRKADVFYKKYNNLSNAWIVLIHGFAEDGNVWKHQTEFLQKKFSLLVPDLPGSGQSQMIKAEMSIDDFAECINEMLVKENIASCILLGHSMGGYITLSFANKYRDKLKAFGLVHSTAFADSAEKKESRKKGIDLMENYGAYNFIRSTTPNLFSTEFKKNDPAEMEALIENGKLFSKDALQQYYKAMMERNDSTFVLKESQVPVLFITGKQDLAVPLSDSLKQMYMPGISYIHILEDTGHMGFLEQAAKVNFFINGFVNDIFKQ